MNTAAPAVHRHTPTLRAFDARGLVIRDIAYLRELDVVPVTCLISRHQHDARGFPLRSADPRLYEQGLWNVAWHTDLAGQALCTRSLDAGLSVTLHDAARRPGLQVDHIRQLDGGGEDPAEAVTRLWSYESPTLRGRVLTLSEQLAGQPARITERFVYAAATPAEQALNLAGLCVQHFDPAGVVVIDQMTLTGVALSLSRFLLDGADDAEHEADWQQATLPLGDVHTSLTRSDATGAVLTTTDAAGHRQRIAYDLAGQLRSRWLVLPSGEDVQMVAALDYDAAGNLLRQVHGNGVEVSCRYEAQTLRLAAIRVERPAGHPLGAALLQDLRYEYDPVGHVTGIANEAAGPTYWRNQRVSARSTYRHDSLYRLVEATGREMASAHWQGGRLMPVAVALDDATYTRYAQGYRYDHGGNLRQIRHSAPVAASSHTTEITVSACSNRAVLASLGDSPQQVDALFTAAGAQRQLNPGQALRWTPRAELRSVVLATRDVDQEHYRYDAASQRVLKVTRSSGAPTRRVVYLPNLELRSMGHGDEALEALQVIQVPDSGRVRVRLLHWQSGKPDGIDNDQLRYSYTTLTGSCGLEIDGNGALISNEEFYPFGGTAIWTARNALEADYKTLRYSGKEHDASGLCYFGYRYYQPWVARWLSADPAGTRDGLNPYAMVGNDPVSFFDAQGLMRRSPQAGGSRPSTPPFITMARGLHQFPSLERRQVIDALQDARGIMAKVLHPDPLPDEEMRTWFGPAYPMQARQVVETWGKVAQFLTTYSSPYPGYDKFHRVLSPEPDQYALVDSDDFDGVLRIDSGFFDSSTSAVERTATVIHELSHLSRVSKVPVPGPGTRDFFYLLEGNARRDSDRMVNKGDMAPEDLEDPQSLFNEIATLDNLVVEHVDETVMKYSTPLKRDFMVVRQARHEFESRPLLRARVAARNADSIAQAAMAIAARRP